LVFNYFLIMGIFKFYKNKKSSSQERESIKSIKSSEQNVQFDESSNKDTTDYDAKLNKETILNESQNSNPQIPKDETQKTSEKLGFFGLAKNLASSLVAWQKAGRPVVSSEQWNFRISICRNCPYWQEVGNSQIARCTKCGCSSGKLLLATSKCPLDPPRWNAYK
jgi:hypothetical protein